MAEEPSFLDHQAATRLMAQPLYSRFAMEGAVSGHHRSPHRGSSVEFAEYRNYVPGDDIRRLDWRVYGRSDKFFLKEFEAETNLRCYFLLDCSASMGFEGESGSRFDYARRLIATLAYLVTRQGDAVGLIEVGPKGQKELPPRRNPAHFRQLLAELNKAAPQGETNLTRAMHELAEKVRRRALVVVLSDLFAPIEDLLASFQHLRYRKHDVAVFHLLDRQELEFKFERPVRFQDLESSFHLVTEPHLIREAYLKQLNDFLIRLRAGCLEYDIDYRQIVTDQDYEKALGVFLAERASLSSSSVR